MAKAPRPAVALRARVREARRRVEAEGSSLGAVQSYLANNGYQSLFSHTQGNKNVFIMWINLQSGDEVVTVSKRGPQIGDTEMQSTAIFRLVPAFALAETIAREYQEARGAR